MPLNRTPPASPAPAISNEAPDNIIPAISCISEQQTSKVIAELPNIGPERKKRKVTSKTTDKNNDHISMAAFNIFSKDQEKRFEDLVEKINNIILQNSELKDSVQLMSNKHDELLKRISELECEREEDKKRIQLLQDSVENLERKSRACGIELRNVPRTSGETKESLCNLVVNVGKTLNVNIEKSNIREVFRVKSKDNSDPIIIEFDSVLRKHNVIKGVKEFNKNRNRNDKLNTTHMGLQSPVQPIYISESLTSKTQKLYAQARAFRKNYGAHKSEGVISKRERPSTRAEATPLRKRHLATSSCHLPHMIPRPPEKTVRASPAPAISNEAPDNIIPAISCISEQQTSKVIAELPNIGPERKKRKVTSKTTDKNNDHISMAAFNIFSKDQEKRFEDLVEKINNIILQNSELKDSVQLMSNKHDELLKRISELECEREEDKKRIQLLQDSVENLERKSRACGIELRNVPRTSGETKESLCNLVVNVGKTLNVNIEKSNIREVFRVKSKDNSDPIIIEFDSVLRKHNVIKGVKEFNKNRNRNDKLNTTHMGLQSPVQPIYISESLTSKTQKLYAQARAFRKNYGYKFCWTSHGIVYLRDKIDSQQIRVNSESDLDKIRNTTM
uniref:FP protein C-terminal domain-containing protein n=1 Tax=Heliothis virescens TaxID=7102 RepID=A0A2A4JFR4_HELVI